MVFSLLFADFNNDNTACIRRAAILISKLEFKCGGESYPIGGGFPTPSAWSGVDMMS